MKLNNHVPHKLKKRVLKKLRGRQWQEEYVSVDYYKLIKIFKDDQRVCRSAYQYLLKRLRVKGAIYNISMESFTGYLSGDFVWDNHPQGHDFWRRLDEWVWEHYKGFYNGLNI